MMTCRIICSGAFIRYYIGIDEYSTTTETDMEREEWLNKCAAQYETRAGLDSTEARELAEIALQAEIYAGTGLDADPEECADEDMDNWWGGDDDDDNED